VRKKGKGIELAVLKGRKADLTRVILQILSSEALVKYDVHKKIVNQGFRDTRYGTIKKRIKTLEETGYLKQVGIRKTQPGSEGILYEATFKAFAALKLNTMNPEELFKNIDEETAIELLGLLTRIYHKNHSMI
jgi:DNA-binding PadR family transcriptional regulator